MNALLIIFRALGFSEPHGLPSYGPAILRSEQSLSLSWRTSQFTLSPLEGEEVSPGGLALFLGSLLWNAFSSFLKLAYSEQRY